MSNGDPQYFTSRVINGWGGSTSDNYTTTTAPFQYSVDQNGNIIATEEIEQPNEYVDYKYDINTVCGFSCDEMAEMQETIKNLKEVIKILSALLPKEIKEAILLKLEYNGLMKETEEECPIDEKLFELED